MADEPMDRRPRLLVPPGACDCHVHIFGPRVQFPLAAELAYTPAEAPLEAYRELQCRLGLSRTVVVQPSAYGTNNACTLDAIARLQPHACGVAVVDPSVTEAELVQLHAAGIRGLRFSLTVKNAMRPEHLLPMARRIHPLGWHIQFRSTHRDLPDVADRLRSLPVNVCLDHMSSIPPEVPLTHPAWTALFRLLEGGRCWVKLSAPYQLSRMPRPAYADFGPQVTALVKAAPERMVWGTNWPHPMVEAKPDDAGLLDWLGEWVPEASLRQMILVDNPVALYGFH